MNEPFAMDRNVWKQLQVINSLEIRTDTIVQSLYAKAVLEYSRYYFKKQCLEGSIDQALEHRNKTQFHEAANALAAHLNEYKNGRTIQEDGYTLWLTFEQSD
ncbi:IDEAL domain-containing protein [Shouchella shacheensis]|uniref:IDEAL domain-containing protein n=1 Tax=Shouchella shacheensis TaxID=1649580 RepID=UPI00073FEC12|nr:IDEAL domain-containing protein [Shouchella shacheensis]